jgi:hypothetical protein
MFHVLLEMQYSPVSVTAQNIFVEVDVIAMTTQLVEQFVPD